MAYRDSPRELPPRDRDVLWRFRVARAAMVLFWTLVAQAALYTFIQLVWAFSGFFLHDFVTPRRLMVTWPLGLAIAAVQTWFTWQLTSPRPVSEFRKRRRLRGWLRGLVLVMLLLRVRGVIPHTPMPFPWITGYAYSALDIAVSVLGLLYLRELFREFLATHSADLSTRLARRYGIRIAVLWGLSTAVNLAFVHMGSRQWISLISSVGVVGIWLPSVVIFGVGLTVAKVGFDVLNLLERLTATLRVTSHEWWFKPGVGWASLAVSRASAEVIEPTGGRVLMADLDAARRWLTDNDYTAERKALDEAMVLAAPPPIDVDVRRARTRVARKSVPRMRVDVEGKPEEVVEHEEAVERPEAAARAAARRSPE